MSCLPYIGIAACTASLEVGWIFSVRFVSAGRAIPLIASAMFMQAISNASTLILVSDGWTSIASVMGAALGVLIGMGLDRRSLSAV